MWNSLCGYVMIRMDGLGLERMLNSMLQAGIPVWNVRREGRTRMTAEISAKDFLRLRSLRKGARCRIHIAERHGMPFLLARFRFRKLLVLGALLCFALLAAAQTRVWHIRVEGCARVPEAVVLRALAEAQAEVGMACANVEAAALGQAVRAYDSRIAWTGIRLDGVIMQVQVVEAEPIPELPDKSQPADVVAKKDGIVERVTALSGKASVKPGDAVRLGDILIRGDITREGAAERLLVYAEGEVFAQVWYTASVTLPNTQQRLLRSGRTAPYRAVLIAGYPVYRTAVDYDAYELETTDDAVFRGLILPVRQVRGVCHELTEQEVIADQEEILSEALFRAELEAIERVPKTARILKKVSETTVLEDGGITAVVAICTQEQIGMTREIDAAQLAPLDEAQ